MNNNTKIHIGQIIRTQLKADGRSAVWLAQKLSCSPNHIYKILSKSYLDTALLLQISLILHYDFFKYYSDLVNDNI